MRQASYSLRTPRNYAKNGNALEVVWYDVFMPFDVARGMSDLPPDNHNYKRFKQSHWWVCPRTTSRPFEHHDLSEFIELPPVKEYASLEEAINFCIEWRKEWLEKELAITFSSDTALPADE